MKILEFGPSAMSTPKNQPVTIFFHGFPGLKSKQNREIAEAVAAITHRRTLVVLYSGLTQAPGTFNFPTCLDEVLAWFKKEEPTFGEIELVGHSWGGFLSLKLASLWPERIRRIVLLSPLLKFVGSELAEPAFAQTARDHQDLSMVPARELALAFTQCGFDHDTSAMAAAISPRTRVLLLQAREDAITPSEYSQALTAKFQRPPRFELVENDHSFLADRPALAKKIAAFLEEA